MFIGPSVTWSHKTLHQLKNKHPYDFDLDHTPELLNVKRANEANGLLAAYVAFAMTKYGHL